MKIERNFDIVIETKRRFIIRQIPSGTQTVCAECGASVLAIAQAAVLLGIKQRRIFKIIEAGAAHFTETEAGALLVCLTSLMKFLDCES